VVRRKWNHIQSGFDHEKRLFGHSTEEETGTLFPYKYPFKESVKRVMETPIITETEDGSIEYYNPADPNERWGMAGQVLSAVKKHLPRRVRGKRVGPIFLYPSLGTGLDTFYGVDAFFYWNNMVVTVDASTRFKSKDPADIALGLRRLKADFLLLPEDIQDKKSIDGFGNRVASMFKDWEKRKRREDQSRKKKKGQDEGFDLHSLSS